LNLGERVCTLLNSAGYSYCKGLVMAKTPRWCQPLATWKQYFFNWATKLEPQDLMEANTTLKVLLDTIEKDQEELKERFLTNIKEQVLPYLDKLKKRTLRDAEKGIVQMVEANLNEIASPFVQKLTSKYLNLTKKEIQVANLVKEGKTSKEIAELLNAKKRVVEFHRENIRKKLGLKHKKESLAISLRTFA